MAIQFTKMHGLGNDYVYVNLFEETVPDAPALAVAVSDRHFGIGADGLILIGPSDTADVRMQMFNADGSEAEMCGNGVRCVAKYACDHGLAEGDEIRVETRGGVKAIQVAVDETGKVASARVDMGEPRLARGDIPMTGDPEAQCVDEPITVNGHDYTMTCVNMGNPHVVIFVDSVESIPLGSDGRTLEHHDLFPERTNVHFVQVLGDNEVRMRTWERGSGITLACGTGASAVCIAGALTGRTGRSVLAHLPGGELQLNWADDNRLFMTGPATEVFTGTWPE